MPWGWKSPLTTFTLPIWLDLVPHAKVIHIYRHGVDVANSLRQRENRDWERRAPFSKGVLPVSGVTCHPAKDWGVYQSPPCDSLEGGLTLWEEYVAEARAHVQASG